LALSGWIITTAVTVAGIIVIALATTLKWSGIDLLIGPLLITSGVVAGALLAGLRNPWWVLFLFIGIESAFIAIHYFDLFGLGSVI